MRILIAEDNPDNMDILARRLRRKGFDVFEVTDGQQAVDAASYLKPDIILLDISMPRMSGLDAAKEIRKRETYKEHIPIIALTAHAMETDKERSLEAGCDAFATKPIEFSSLLETISALRGA